MTVYMYHHWGLEMMLLYKHIGADSLDSSDYSYFVKKHTKLEYTEEEKSALAVFILVIVFSIIEMILAAGIAKSSDKGYLGSSDQPHQMYYMYYQVSRPYHVQASAARCYILVVKFELNLFCFFTSIRPCVRGGWGHNVSALTANVNDFFSSEY